MWAEEKIRERERQGGNEVVSPAILARFTPADGYKNSDSTNGFSGAGKPATQPKI